MVAWKRVNVMLLAGFKQWYERIELVDSVAEFGICLMRGEGVMDEGKGLWTDRMGLMSDRSRGVHTRRELGLLLYSFRALPSLFEDARTTMCVTDVCSRVFIF